MALTFHCLASCLVIATRMKWVNRPPFWVDKYFAPLCTGDCKGCKAVVNQALDTAIQELGIITQPGTDTFLDELYPCLASASVRRTFPTVFLGFSFNKNRKGNLMQPQSAENVPNFARCHWNPAFCRITSSQSSKNLPMWCSYLTYFLDTDNTEYPSRFRRIRVSVNFRRQILLFPIIGFAKSASYLLGIASDCTVYWLDSPLERRNQDIGSQHTC